jgi:hypothetical protein
MTDTLVELLLPIAHRVEVKAEEKVDTALLRHVKQVMGTTRLLYKLAKGPPKASRTAWSRRSYTLP